MAKVPNAVEILPKISTVWVGCTSVTEDKRTDGRAIAYSEREREFTFAKTFGVLLIRNHRFLNTLIAYWPSVINGCICVVSRKSKACPLSDTVLMQLYWARFVYTLSVEVVVFALMFMSFCNAQRLELYVQTWHYVKGNLCWSFRLGCRPFSKILTTPLVLLSLDAWL